MAAPLTTVAKLLRARQRGAVRAWVVHRVTASTPKSHVLARDVGALSIAELAELLA
jgi:hypothetical protein